jgi:predicted DNA-binding protein YlxM (UPF0122 family)
MENQAIIDEIKKTKDLLAQMTKLANAWRSRAEVYKSYLSPADLKAAKQEIQDIEAL